MGSRKLQSGIKRNETLEVSIQKMAFGGRGIARIDTEAGELVVFVPNTIPGQIVRCRVVKSRKNHIEAKLLTVLERSPDEVEIPYQPIPGAPYATLPIQKQEAYKKQTTIDLMARIGEVQDAKSKLDTFLSSPQHWHYRNKMEYSFGSIRYDLETQTETDSFALGFKHRGTWWMVENLDKDSGLFDADVENNLHKIRTYCEATGLPAWHAPRREGFFRFLTVRKSHIENKVLFNLVTTGIGLELFDLNQFADFLVALFGKKFAGLIHTENNDTGERVQPLEGEGKLIAGVDHIRENLNGLNFDISMQSFFQTNPGSAAHLYEKAIAYLKSKIQNKGIIFDLYSGTGTITQLVARNMPEAEVVGVEFEETAVADAKRAAVENGVSNCKFYAADVNKFLYTYPQYVGKIDAVILDPPRAGIAPKALRRIIDLQAPVLVYISCNPATLARDTESLTTAEYRLLKFALVDQFPHTSHVEAIALFEKQK